MKAGTADFCAALHSAPEAPPALPLPDPPPGKTGWPWQTNADPAPRWVHSTPPPRITIVTPSYNQGAFLEETLRSILLQGYPNLEYIVMDGGSDDDSVRILEKYQPWLSYWISTRDLGQADALNKGLARTSGVLGGWINSDDILLPGALWTLAALHAQQPDAILLGDVLNIHAEQGQVWRISQHNVSFKAFREHWRDPVTWHQPGTFFPLALYRRIAPFDLGLALLFDWDFMCRALQNAPVAYCSEPVARFRYHSNSKTLNTPRQWIREKQAVTERYWPETIACNPGLAEAVLHLVAADTYLAVHWRNPREGRTYLWRSALADWQVLGWPRYWLLWLKAFLPLPWLQGLRRIRKAF